MQIKTQEILEDEVENPSLLASEEKQVDIDDSLPTSKLEGL